MKKTPLQQVKEQFGTKAALASKLLSLLSRPEGEEAAEFEQRVSTASNKQLLRLWAAEQRVAKDFGSKEQLVDTIVRARFAGSDNADYRAKIARYTNTRLLDLHRQTVV